MIDQGIGQGIDPETNPESEQGRREVILCLLVLRETTRTGEEVNMIGGEVN